MQSATVVSTSPVDVGTGMVPEISEGLTVHAHNDAPIPCVSTPPFPLAVLNTTGKVQEPVPAVVDTPLVDVEPVMAPEVSERFTADTNNDAHRRLTLDVSTPPLPLAPGNATLGEVQEPIQSRGEDISQSSESMLVERRLVSSPASMPSPLLSGSGAGRTQSDIGNISILLAEVSDEFEHVRLV